MLLSVVLLFGLIPQTLFAEETMVSPLDYEISQKISEDGSTSTISLHFKKMEGVKLDKIKLPDGKELREGLSNITYNATKNDTYKFTVSYIVKEIMQEETISEEVTQIAAEKKSDSEKEITVNNTEKKITSNEEKVTREEKNLVEVNSSEEKSENKNANGRYYGSKKNSSPQYIHLNTVDGNDQNNGLTSDASVKTFEKAKSLINNGDIILIDRTVKIEKDEVWDLSDKPSSKIQRNSGFDMIEIDGKHTLTLNHVHIDGENYSQNSGQSRSIIGLGKAAGKEENSATVILNSGTILENNKSADFSGGAIAAYSYNKIIMNEGVQIRNNGVPEVLHQCANFGGAISLENHSQFIMNGGVIDNNHAIRGGGVSIVASSMEMNGGQIRNNSANRKNSYQGHYGGGIYLSNYQDWSNVGGDLSRNISGEASFVMNGGTISNNQATYYNSNGDKGLGGAIGTFPRFDVGFETTPKITIDINGGSILDNKAINGGAISSYFEATKLDISNATISNNQANSQGGGIYGVFNTDIKIDNTVISNNKASLGAGIYLNSSEMLMESGEISQNQASSKGGGIYIDNGKWNKQEANCTLLGGTVTNNTAMANTGSDGIYQNSVLNIGEKVRINKNNDVYLPSGKVINAIKPLYNINRQNSVSITSKDCIIENDVDAGTKLVNYFDDAGGIPAAVLAEENQIYIPSQYMQEGLIIGKSQADSQLNYMTYVNKAKYQATYEFISGTNGKELPREITDLLPNDVNVYIEGTKVIAIQPARTNIKVDDGIWRFKGYDANEKVAKSDVKFIGTWEFVLNAGIINEIPKINSEDKEFTASDELNLLDDVIARNKPDNKLNNDNTSQTNGNVQTGDTINIIFWYGMLLLSLSLFIALIVRKKLNKR